VYAPAVVIWIVEADGEAAWISVLIGVGNLWDAGAGGEAGSYGYLVAEMVGFGERGCLRRRGEGTG